MKIKFPRRWCSAKNNTMVWKVGNRYSIGPNKKAKEDKKYVRDWLTCATVRETLPVWEDDDVKVTLIYDIDTKEVEVEFESLGPRPKSPTGRKFDLHNLTDILLDMAQGIVFKNDNQIAEIHFKRVKSKK